MFSLLLLPARFFKPHVICCSFIYFFSHRDDWQAKKDLSSHCDQIVMSLASLNKQKSLEKQQPQSIKTTVTISKVSRTPIDSMTPVMAHKKQISTESSIDMGSQPSIASNESSQTVREMQKFRNTSVDAVDDPLIQADIIAKRKQLAKERFLSESSISNGEHVVKWIRFVCAKLRNKWENLIYCPDEKQREREKKKSFQPFPRQTKYL